MFYAANQLYGITFKERKDIPVYNPDVRVFEVFDTDGSPLALFYCDYFKRDNKSGGAWMSNFVDQSKLLGTLPVVYNVCNFTKPAPGQPALLSFRRCDHDVPRIRPRAAWHVRRHANIRACPVRHVPRDFVEFPSQFNEHWASYPAVFSHYAKHYKTGAPMPAELVGKDQEGADLQPGLRAHRDAGRG